MMNAEEKWGPATPASWGGPAAVAFFSLCCGACNLAIGLEKKDLPRKQGETCTSSTDCDDGHGCTDDICQLQGTSGTCTHYIKDSTVVCRPKLDDPCDLEAEYCDGESYDCPEDTFAPDTTECRPSAGQCDEPEFCTGSDSSCPEDAFSLTDKVCDDEDDCTHDDLCDGEGACSGINGLYDVEYLSAGPWGYHTCALLFSGELRCWGGNNYGQIGDGTTVHKYIPTPVMGLPEGDAISQISGGGRHVNVLLDSGRILAWGLGDTGQLGNGEYGESYLSFTPVEVLWSAGVTAYGWAQVSSGYLFNCGVQEDGSAWCWGKNDHGQLGIGTYSDEDFEEFPVAVTGLAEASSLTCGSYHSCAMEPAGSLMCWGRNDRGQMANATAPSPSPVPVPVEGISGRVTDVAVGVLHTCALRESGEVMCWGTNEYGQLGNGSDTTVNTSVPVEVSDLPRTVLDIDTEFEHICALLEGGEMMCWGQNSDGQLGDGTMDNIRTTPVSVQGLPSAVTAMTLGALHTCVLLENATVWCWGHNSFGEIGIGSDEPEQRPEPGEVHCR